MMSSLTLFLKSLAAAFGEEPRAAAMSRLIEKAAKVAGPNEKCQAQRLPVCTWVVPALASARAHSDVISRLADGFYRIEPLLRWAPRCQEGLSPAPLGRKAMPTP